MGHFETVVDEAVNGGRPYEAYVPSRLQDIRIDLPPEVAARIDRASRSVAEIDARLGLSPALPALETLVKSEAIASSYIEGHRVSAADLARESNDFRTAPEDVRAVMGNIEATHRAVRSLSDPGYPVTLQDVERIQSDLMETHPRGGVRSPYVGVRTTQAVLIPPGMARGESASLELATHIPPPARLVGGALADLLDFINAPPTGAPPLVRAALAHAQFETIHPFPDGNGRTGRALIQAMFRRDGLLKNVVLPLSPYLAMNTSAYVDGLNSVRFEGSEPDQQAMERWLVVFADCTYSAAVNASDVATDIERLGERWAEQLRGSGVRTGAAAFSAVNHLLGAVSTTTRDLASALDVGEVTARTALTRLEKIGAVSVSKLRDGSLVYVADEVAEVIARSQRDIAVTSAPGRAKGVGAWGGASLPPMPSSEAPARANPKQACGAWISRSRQQCNLREGHVGWPNSGHRHVRR